MGDSDLAAGDERTWVGDGAGVEGDFDGGGLGAAEGVTRRSDPRCILM